jgi:hypothetical protein
MTGSGSERLPYFAVASPRAFITWSRSARVQHAVPERPGLFERIAGVHPVNCIDSVVDGVRCAAFFVEAGRVMRFVGSMVLPR